MEESKVNYKLKKLHSVLFNSTDTWILQESLILIYVINS